MLAGGRASEYEAMTLKEYITYPRKRTRGKGGRLGDGRRGERRESYRLRGKIAQPNLYVNATGFGERGETKSGIQKRISQVCYEGEFSLEVERER